MSDADNSMQFQKNYFTEKQMQKGGKGAFSSQFTSYISEGKTALKDNIYQTRTQKDRQDVMRDIRAGLRARMQENNQESDKAAKAMMKEHKDLRQQMREALLKAKEATRQKRLLKARLLEEKSKQSNQNAEESSNELQQMIDSETSEIDQDVALNDQKKGRQRNRDRGNIPQRNVRQRNAEQAPRVFTRTADEVSEKDIANRKADLAKLKTYKNTADQNIQTVHKKNLFSMFRAISKKMDRNSVESDIADQESIIREQQRVLRDKTRAWNEKRKRDYDSGSFRQYYNDYDSAIQSYRALNRNNADSSIVPEKNIVEYVGEFDLIKLDDTLGKLETNPYLNVDIAIKNKKDGRGTKDAELLKSHRKITLLSEEDEQGLRTRFKLNNDFTGYKAARQFDPDTPTALTQRQAGFRKTTLRANQMRLEVDEKDAGNKYINSQENLEIIQAKTKFLLTGKKVNGVFLNGEFLSANRNVIKGSKDSYTIGMKNTWGYTKQKEEIRKAVLKADIFRLINAKTIQAAAGYEASKSTGVTRIQDGIKKIIIKKCKLSDKEADSLFSEQFEKKILSKTAKIPDGKEKQWISTLFGTDEKKKNALPDEVKIKVAYDVIRKEISTDKKKIKDIANNKTNIGKAFEIVSKDQKSVIDLSLLLLSDDDHPEFWDVAKEICTKHMPHKFGLHINEQKDTATMKRTVNYGRAENGQLMRVALIDELNTQRKNFDITNLFGAMMPTWYKQYIEDLEAKRGTGNILKLKALDGTFLKFIGDVFDAAFNIGNDMKLLDDDTARNMFVANIYMGAVTSCMNIGAITQGTAYALSELGGNEEYTGDDGKVHYTADDRKFTIGMVFSMVKNIATLVKAVQKWKEKQDKETKLREQKEPDYDAKLDYASTQDKYSEIIFNLFTLAATMGTECAKYANDKVAKNVCNLVKHMLGTLQGKMEMSTANHRVMRIENAEKDFKTVADKDQKNADDNAMLEVLKQNSQLQYGMSLAKKKAKDDYATSALKTIKSAGKSILAVLKTAKIDKAFPPLVIFDGAWTVLTSIAETGQEIYQHEKNVTATAKKMLGNKVKDINKSVLTKVLKRETGIVSANYLPDLARIFMAINTHQFMQKAETDQEKKVGSKIATAILNNKNYTPDKLGKVKSKDLMKAMGVKGNFKKILTHALA